MHLPSICNNLHHVPFLQFLTPPCLHNSHPPQSTTTSTTAFHLRPHLSTTTTCIQFSTLHHSCPTHLSTTAIHPFYLSHICTAYHQHTHIFSPPSPPKAHTTPPQAHTTPPQAHAAPPQVHTTPLQAHTTPPQAHNTTASTHNTTASTYNTTASTHNTTASTHNTTASTHNTTARTHNTTASTHNTTTAFHPLSTTAVLPVSFSV